MEAERVMKVWLPFTLLAATLQALRTSLQHRLRALLSVSGAGFVRYVYGAPVSLAAVGVMALAGVHLSAPPARFWPIVAAAGVAQIFGTVFLIRAFDARNFAVGTVFSKTEVIQVAVFSWLILGETIRPLGWLAIVLCLVGIAVLASKGRDTAKLASAFRDRSGQYGIAAGGALGLAAIALRSASRSLGNSSGIVRAIETLAVMNTMQTVLHGGYLLRREPDQIRKAIVHWQSSAIVGLLSVCGSAGWAIALTYGNAAQVRTVGQFELVVTFAIAHFWLHDRHSRAEYAASALVAVGVVTMLLGG
jgi:drug/metabolite transporter (DMT)-like permease